MTSSDRQIEAIQRARQQVLNRIRRANSVTEQESLAVGQSLGAIVSEARAHAAESRHTLEDYAESGLARQMDQQNEALAEFLETMERHTNAQVRAATLATTQINRIVALGQAIERVTLQAKMLALNATIEASRMGKAGAAFHVISQEMKQFSHAVNETSTSVQHLAEQLLRTIPEMAQIADIMKSATTDFASQAQAQIATLAQANDSLGANVTGSLQAGDVRLERVLNLSYEALSHLQFQDTVAQSLLGCERILDVLVDEIQRPELVGTNESDTSTKVTEPSLLDLEAGEILMF